MGAYIQNIEFNEHNRKTCTEAKSFRFQQKQEKS